MAERVGGIAMEYGGTGSVPLLAQFFKNACGADNIGVDRTNEAQARPGLVGFRIRTPRRAHLVANTPKCLKSRPNPPPFNAHAPHKFEVAGEAKPFASA